MLDQEETSRLLDGIKIPPAPHIVTRLHEELQKDEPVLAEVADIIAQDLGMSGLVLRTVNSSFFGLRAKIRSIHHAVNLMGMNYTINIVTGLALRKTFEQAKGASPPNFWDSPTNVAMLSAAIARKVSDLAPDEAHMLGLFHNSGHALLNQRFADYGAFIQKNLNLEDQSIVEAEDRRYNTQHAILGYFLARTWGLDKSIANVIRDHHDVLERLHAKTTGDEAELMLLCILKIAEHVDKVFWGISPDHEWMRVQDDVLHHVGMSQHDFEELRDELSEMLIDI